MVLIIDNEFQMYSVYLAGAVRVWAMFLIFLFVIHICYQFRLSNSKLSLINDTYSLLFLFICLATQCFVMTNTFAGDERTISMRGRLFFVCIFGHAYILHMEQ